MEVLDLSWQKDAKCGREDLAVAGLAPTPEDFFVEGVAGRKASNTDYEPGDPRLDQILQMQKAVDFCNGIDSLTGEPLDPSLPDAGACPIREACLEHALSLPEPFGVWGGKTIVERRQILKARAAERAEKRRSQSGRRRTKQTGFR